LLKLLKINTGAAFNGTLGYKFAFSYPNIQFMKNIKFLLGLFAVVIIMASCATTQGAYEDDYDNTNTRTRQIGNRVYMEDPYRGTVVLERDPYTGRYYDVTYGSRFGSIYNNPYGGYYRRTPVYQRSNTDRGNVGNGNVVRPQQESREQIRQDRNATRSRVLGN
jgi:hypothetical protein